MENNKKEGLYYVEEKEVDNNEFPKVSIIHYKKLIKGDIFKIKRGFRVYVNNFPKHFLFDNTDFNFSLGRGELPIGVTHKGLDTSIFIGYYLVYKAILNGGGSLGNGDTHPDGHHVYARKLIDYPDDNFKISEFEIDFFQSGGFTCILENIPIIDHITY